MRNGEIFYRGTCQVSGAKAEQCRQCDTVYNSCQPDNIMEMVKNIGQSDCR